MPNLGNLDIPDTLPAPSMEGAQGSSASEFTSGVTGSTSIEFPILENPSSLINLLFGKPVTLVEIQLPELGFQFNYRQSSRSSARSSAPSRAVSAPSSICGSATTRRA